MKLIFLSLPTVVQAVTRVQLRVRQGGHSIPAEVIARRFTAGLQNLETLYKPLVDEWQMIDNGGTVPQFLSEGGRP